MVGQDVTGQARRLELIAGLAERIRARAHDLDARAAFPAATFAELRQAGLLALTAPVEIGGAGLWSEGRYRPYYELIEALARIDSVTAQLLQVHSHALGIACGLADATQRETLMAPIVAGGGLLASVGSEARPTGKLADIARTELEERPGGGYTLTCQKYFASGSSAADELLIWTAVPGSGPYTERSMVVLVPADAPEVELIDQWDVMGMRATVSHSVRITGYEVPAERLIGEPGAWTRRDPRTFSLAFAANHIGAAGAAMDVHRELGPRSPGAGRLGDHACHPRAHVESTCSPRVPRCGPRRTCGTPGITTPPSWPRSAPCTWASGSRWTSRRPPSTCAARAPSSAIRSSSACTATCARSRCTTATSSTWSRSARR